MSNRPPPLPQDGIYRAILAVMVASVILGAVIALVGELVYHDKTISRVGTWAVLISGAIYFVFRWLGRREAKRQAERGDRERQGRWDDWDERDE
ncbi:MAG: hypothetical protein MI920_00610 [Kiloniellales bacterium]|nr:hypothetical protein [Kiloniellales bacterium]